MTIDRDALVDLTRRLVRVRSVNQDGFREAPAAQIVIDLARSFGWEPVVEEVAPGRPNVIITIDGGRPGKTLMFEGHTDVVTEGDPATWTHDPYGAEIVEGRIYGRGAADMKGGVAAMILAARAVEEAGPFPGRIRLGVLCDEEEMMIGVHDFVRRGHAADVDGVIVCEPEGGEICASQKGAMRMRVDLHGRMAHGAMPHQGRNPIVAAAELVVRLRAVEHDLQSRHGVHEHLGSPYVTPTHVVAGTLAQLNVIPADAVFTLDIRTIPGIDHADLVDRIRTEADAVTEAGDVKIELTVLVDRPATDTAVDDPVVVAVADAHRRVRGEEPVYGGVPGTTDGTILWRDAELPVVVYGPGGKWIAHQADEFVEIDELVTAAEVYLEAARQFLGATA